MVIIMQCYRILQNTCLFGYEIVLKIWQEMPAPYENRVFGTIDLGSE